MIEKKGEEEKEEEGICFIIHMKIVKRQKIISLAIFQGQNSLFFVSTNSIWREKFDDNYFFSL